MLAEAQKGIEERMDRLEQAVERLADHVSKLSASVGRLAEPVGFGPEDMARVVVPGWLERHERIMVPELVRRLFEVEGGEVEVNPLRRG